MTKRKKSTKHNAAGYTLAGLRHRIEENNHEIDRAKKRFKKAVAPPKIIPSKGQDFSDLLNTENITRIINYVAMGGQVAMKVANVVKKFT